ncbi:MAG: cell division protein FtsL [Clostridiales bacterium]|nr:cell division protein FtsL [Clostridiales bacterium]
MKNTNNAFEYDNDENAYGPHEFKSKVIEELRTKRRNKKIKSGILVKVVILFIIGVIVLFRYASITELGYKVNSANTQYTTLINENERLKVEIAKSINLEDIKKIAEERLDMHRPGSYQVIHISVSPIDEINIEDSNQLRKVDNRSWYEKIRDNIKIFLGLT